MDKDFREVHAPDGIFLAFQYAVDLHEAAQVIGNHHIGACFQDGVALHFSHGSRNFRILYRECAAKSATGLGFFHFEELQSAHVPQEFAGLSFDAHFAKSVASVVEGRLCFKMRAEICHAELVHKKCGEFVDLWSECAGCGAVLGPLKKLSVKHLEHRAAGARSCHDYLCVLEKGHHMARRPPCLIPVTRVEWRLAAAGLPLGVIHFVTKPLEDIHHRHRGLRIELLNKTRDKEGNLHGAVGCGLIGNYMNDLGHIICQRIGNWQGNILPCRGLIPEKGGIHMAKQSIAFLGPEGTFSHLVALRRFGAGREMLPCADLPGAFEVLRGDERAAAVVPIENSSGGTIYDTVDLLIAEAGRVHVREDVTLDVRLALLGHKGARVREVFSHFAPLQHHRGWLLENFPGVKIRPVASTALAASLAARSKTAAALCAPGAAVMHGLDVLVFPVQPGAINVTRFYVVGRQPVKIPTSLPQDKLYKTTLVFRLKNRCGSLHSFLGPFSRAGVNLRMIVSRPVPGHPETYVFFCEVEGVAQAEPLRSALARAGKFCESLQVLGSFPSGRKFAS